MSWTDDDPDDEDFDDAREWEPLDCCPWCGDDPCTCHRALFDADELGLDPEDDDAR